jgi:dephospho-CoA kinase
MIIGLTGYVTAGKSTVASYLQTKRFELLKYSESTLAKVMKFPNGEYVFDDLKFPDEIIALKKCGRFTLWSVEAPMPILYERLKITQGQNLGTFAEFRQAEATELTSEAGQKLFQCRKLANYNIVNDGSLAELYYKIDLILQDL